MEILLLALLAGLSGSSGGQAPRERSPALGDRPFTPLGPVRSRVASRKSATRSRTPTVVTETPPDVKPPSGVDKSGQLVSRVLGDCAAGAGTGAAIGSALGGPGLGTALGAGIGCLAFNVPRIIVAAQGGDPAEV